MQIRLRGKPAEIAEVLAAIEHVLDIAEVSRIYSDRRPSRLSRCYLTATIKSEIKESA